MRFSRHAKNEMRLYGITSADIDSALSHVLVEEKDERGNTRLTGVDPIGRAIIVVVAGDEPGYVITTFPDD